MIGASAANLSDLTIRRRKPAVVRPLYGFRTGHGDTTACISWPRCHYRGHAPPPPHHLLDGVTSCRHDSQTSAVHSITFDHQNPAARAPGASAAAHGHQSDAERLGTDVKHLPSRQNLYIALNRPRSGTGDSSARRRRRAAFCVLRMPGMRSSEPAESHRPSSTLLASSAHGLRNRAHQ